MKKIAIVSLCLLFLGASIAAAAPGMRPQILQPIEIAATGTFFANVSVQRPGPNATIIGTITGNYTAQNNRGRFNGTWTTVNYTGTLQGRFGRHHVMGRISMMVNGTQRSLPFIGFLVMRDGVFGGRAMSYIGPALYFKGTYT